MIQAWPLKRGLQTVLKIREKRVEEERMDVTIFCGAPRLNYLHIAIQERVRAFGIGCTQTFVRALLTLAMTFSRNISELAK